MKYLSAYISRIISCWYILMLTANLYASQGKILLNNNNAQQCYSVDVVEASPHRYCAKITINYLLDDVELIEGEFFHRLSLGMESSFGNEGCPSLPLISQFLAIPSESVPDFFISDSSWVDIPIGKPMPKQRSWNRQDDISFSYNKEVYSASKYTPQLMAISDIMKWNGIPNVSIHICPFRYYPLQNKLSVLKEFTINVEYSVKKDRAEYDVLNNSRYSYMFDNVQSSDRDLFTRDYSGTDFLILYGNIEGLYRNPSFLKFLRWKAFKGHRTTVNYIGNIGTTSSAIKAYITSFKASNPNLKYVLFIGDIDEIPWATVTSPWNSEIVNSDYWYGCLDGDNDYEAEVSIGRFPSNNLSEVINMLEKTMNYESKYQPYYDKALLVSNWRYHPVYESYSFFRVISDMIYNAQYQDLISFKKLYGGQATPQQGGTNATNDSILFYLNNGANIIHYSGHGSPFCWYDWDYLSEDFGEYEISGLSENTYSLFFSTTCLTGQLDYYPKCMLETYLSSSNGAVAFLGATNQGHNSDENYAIKLFDALLNDHSYHLGQLNIDAHVKNIGSYPGNLPEYHALIYICGGDPTLEIWTDVPNQFSDLSWDVSSDSIRITVNGVDDYSISVVSEYYEDYTLEQIRQGTGSHNSFVRTSGIRYYVINKHNYVPFILKYDDHSHFIQNVTFEHDAYYAGSPISVGNNVTYGSSFGNVLVKKGNRLILEKGNGVTIKNGFEVEKGATFEIK